MIFERHLGEWVEKYDEKESLPKTFHEVTSPEDFKQWWEHIRNRGRNSVKGMLYPDGKVFIWSGAKYLADDWREYEHSTIAGKLKRPLKPIFAFYVWKSDPKSTVQNPDKFYFKVTPSSEPGYYPKYLRRHDGGKYNPVVADILFQKTAADFVIFYDYKMVSREGKIDDTVKEARKQDQYATYFQRLPHTDVTAITASTPPEVFQNFLKSRWHNGGNGELKGLVYPDKLVLWNNNEEHAAVAWQVRKEGERRLPLFPFYLGTYSGVLTAEFSDSARVWFYPKYLKRHDDGKYNPVVEKILFALTTIERLDFSDVRKFRTDQII